MLRKATLEDMRMVWEWRNDDLTRAMSFDTNEVSWEAHQRWFRQTLEEHEKRVLLIYEVNKDPVTVVRLDIAGSSAVVSINVAPNKRGKGHGTSALRLTRDIARELGLQELVAKIKPSNTSSIRCFLRAGYIQLNDEVTMVLNLRGKTSDKECL